MRPKVIFAEPQARHIETALKLVDKTVERVDSLLDRAGRHRGPSSVASSLDEESLRELRGHFHRLQKAVHDLYARYAFRTRQLDLVRVLDAELSSLWEMLENCRPGAMRGYGPMEAETARQLEDDVAALIELVQRARKFLLSLEAARPKGTADT